MRKHFKVYAASGRSAGRYYNNPAPRNYTASVYASNDAYEDWPGKDVKRFVKKHEAEVVSYLNDTTDLWDDEFVDACIDMMLEKLDYAGIDYPDDIESYLVDVFEGYGQM